MSLWLFMADAGSHLLSQNLSLCFWFKVWCSLNMTFGKCHWTLAVFCWLLFYSLVALKVYVLSSLCAGLWVSNSLFVFLSLQVMSWQKAECQHHTSTYESDSRLLLLSVLYTFFAYFDSEGNCAAFSLRCNKVWLDSFTLSCVRLANNDLLSLDPFSPTLAAGSSHSVSSSTGNTSFHLDSCGRVFLHDARFYISTASLNKMCTPIRDRCDSFLNVYFFDFSLWLVWRHSWLQMVTANLKLQQTCAEQLLCREYNRRTSGLSV